MSDYPAWSFRVPLRRDAEPAALRALAAVARDVPPDREDLDALHPVVAYYLEDWARMLHYEPEPYVGSPVRLSGIGTHEPSLTIEFSQHDDEHAEVGYVLWLWVLTLAARPQREPWLIGHHVPTRRYECEWKAITVDPSGIDLHGDPMSWAELDAAWAELVATRTG
ncbi:hypothetical protein AB6N23_02730 [Cellulomonas sp. 179-A 9B4 NHS]|uniref:hypothetical protein n=1 Tax=Cellulomonas sp. 179-A 9B4 NHS TaxID=3142379 RepID=UPI0039A38E9D